MTSWSPLVKLRPAPIENEGQIDVVDPVTGERLRIDSDLLVEFIASEDANASETRVESLRRSLEDHGLLSVDSSESGSQPLSSEAIHWWHRGWGASLEYYLWSLRASFADRNDDMEASIRRTSVSNYLTSDGPPPDRIRPVGDVTRLTNRWPTPLLAEASEILLSRRTTRVFDSSALTLPVLSYVLWEGANDVRSSRRSFDPSKPETYLMSFGVAFDLFVVVYSVNDLGPGIYYYDTDEHGLVSVRPGVFRGTMRDMLFGQPAPSTASFSIFICADFPQYCWRYRHERALRHLYMDTGRLGSDLILAAQAQGLASFETPAVRDGLAAELLRLDRVRQAPLYTITSGIPMVNDGRG